MSSLFNNSKKQFSKRITQIDDFESRLCDQTQWRYIETFYMSKINPKEFVHNTTYWVQLPYIARHSLYALLLMNILSVKKIFHHSWYIVRFRSKSAIKLILGYLLWSWMFGICLKILNFKIKDSFRFSHWQYLERIRSWIILQAPKWNFTGGLWNKMFFISSKWR